MLNYPLTEEIHEEIKEGIEMHKQMKNNIRDPVTGKCTQCPINPKDRERSEFLDYFSTWELEQVVLAGESSKPTNVTYIVWIKIILCIFVGAGSFFFAVTSEFGLFGYVAAPD